MALRVESAAKASVRYQDGHSGLPLALQSEAKLEASRATHGDG
ncbi:MAG: hypothetical protein ACP5O6_06675 [Candidatus Baltobacteraceae bacterium]